MRRELDEADGLENNLDEIYESMQSTFYSTGKA